MAVMSQNSWAAVKMILAAATPIQKLVDRSRAATHVFCNEQAVKILDNDGNTKYAALLKSSLEILNRGTCWADKGWKCFAHYLDPVYCNGFGPWPHAAVECQMYFDGALDNWKKGNKKKSFFLLGAAVHLVQDLCVPHHARGVAFNGHQEYEKWVEEKRLNYAVYENGLYNISTLAGEWVFANARKVRAFYDILTASKQTPFNFGFVTSHVLPLAQRSSAGFFSMFLDYAYRV